MPKKQLTIGSILTLLEDRVAASIVGSAMTCQDVRTRPDTRTRNHVCMIHDFLSRSLQSMRRSALMHRGVERRR